MNTNYKCILACAQKYSIAVCVVVAEATGKVLWKKLLNLEVKQVSNLPCVPSPLLRLVMYMRIYTYTPIYEVMYIHTHIEMKDDVFGHHGLTRWWIAAQLLSYLVEDWEDEITAVQTSSSLLEARWVTVGILSHLGSSQNAILWNKN